LQQWKAALVRGLVGADSPFRDREPGGSRQSEIAEAQIHELGGVDEICRSNSLLNAQSGLLAALETGDKYRRF
jgi:hypothetical protein